MTAIVLLPGLDGTGRLFTEFIAALGREFETIVVSYPPDRVLSYEGLEAIVLAALPRDRPYVLLAESFSGPIACCVASSRPLGLVGLVLCATFASGPVPLSRFFRQLLPWVPFRVAPIGLIARLLWGRWSTRARVSELRSVLGTVLPSVLLQRAESALRVDVSAHLGSIEVPTLCLRPLHDWLVPASCTGRLRSGIPSARVAVVDAPHFVLQAASSQSAALVGSFSRSLAAGF